jgi:hypothetical protein
VRIPPVPETIALFLRNRLTGLKDKERWLSERTSDVHREAKGDIMKKAIWWFALLTLLAVPAAAEIKTSPLFIIERSKNANVVHYDARLTADGKLYPKEPVIAYWVMVTKGGRKEKLNWIEKKKAYGFTIKQDPSVEGYKMTLVAAPERQITVKQDKDAVRAEALIDGRPAVLEKMYINATDGLTGPKVKYIEVYGKDLQTGEERHEKMVPK